MTMITCKECGAPVSSAATACPKCGAPPPKRTGLVTWIIGGFFVIMVINLVSTSVSNSDKVASAPVRASQPPAPPAPPAMFDNFRGLTAMTREVKARMRDPDSFAVDRYGWKNSDTTQCMIYRSRNGFGGMDVGYAVKSTEKSVLNDAKFFASKCAGL